VFDEPVAGRAGGLVELIGVGVEMATGDGDKLFRLQCPLVAGQREVGDRDGVVEADDHQQWCGGDARNPRSRLVHPGGARGTHRHDVLPGSLRRRLCVERDSVGGAVGGWSRGIGADHRLSGGRLAAELAAFIVDESGLQGGLLIGCDPSQALLIAADGRNLGDDCTQPPVGGAEHDGMPAGIAAAPQADPLRVDIGLAFQEGGRPAPVDDLNPRVDVVAWRAVAGSEPAVVVHQNYEARGGEEAGEALQSVFLHPGEAVRHRDGRKLARAIGHKKPAPQFHAAFGVELDVFSVHVPLLSVRKRHNIHDVRVASQEGNPH
jgi:hypothetical protein